VVFFKGKKEMVAGASYCRVINNWTADSAWKHRSGSIYLHTVLKKVHGPVLKKVRNTCRR
jgi:hypothetical protein